MKSRIFAFLALLCCMFIATRANAADPNVYYGGVQIQNVNVIAAFGADNTNATDAGPRLTTALAYLALSGQAAWLPAGTYQVATTITVPSNAVMRGNATTSILNGTMVPSGTQAQAILYATTTTSGSTTLNSTPTVGTPTISIVSNIGGTVVPGSLIEVSCFPAVSLRAQIYKVEAISGGGPYTVTLDRPLRDPTLAAGGTVTLITYQPSNAVIDSLTFKGTATRFMEFVSVRNFIGSNLTLDGSSMTTPADILASYDIGGFQNTWYHVLADMANNTMTSGAIAIESEELDTITNSYVSRASTTSQSAFEIFDSWDSILTNDEAETSYVGFQVTADGNTHGSDGTFLQNDRAFNSTFAGLYNAAGSTNTVVMGSTFRWQTDYGILTDGNTVGLTVVGGEASNSSAANALMYLSSGTAQTKVVGEAFIGGSSSSFGIQMAGSGDLQIADSTIAGSLSTALSVPTGADVDIDGLGITATLVTGILQNSGVTRMNNARFVAAGGGANLIQANAGRVDVSNSEFLVSGTANLLVTAAAAAVITTSQVKATSGGGYAFETAGGTARVGPGCNFTGYANYWFNSGGFINRKQTVTGAPGGTAVSWPNLGTTDTVTLIPKGAVFTGYVSAFTPGTGFTVTDAASGTYEYDVE